MRHIMRFLARKPLLRLRPEAVGPTRQFLCIAKKLPMLVAGAAISPTVVAYTPSAHGFAQKAVDQLIERRECLRCDLRGADLSHKRLRGVNLSGAYFIGANLGKVILRDSMMARAKLAEARLRKADISGARSHKTSFWQFAAMPARFCPSRTFDAALQGTCVMKRTHRTYTTTKLCRPTSLSIRDDKL